MTTRIYRTYNDMTNKTETRGIPSGLTWLTFNALI